MGPRGAALAGVYAGAEGGGEVAEDSVRGGGEGVDADGQVARGEGQGAGDAFEALGAKAAAEVLVGLGPPDDSVREGRGRKG
jgi:hypothetical protein